MGITKDQFVAWFDELQRIYSANRERLTELDSAIGDADHGSNMDRGFTAVQKEIANAPSIPAMLKTAATTLIKTVGGASGPLYGTFFLRAAAMCPDKPELDASEVATLFAAGVEGVAQRGKAVRGEKTMLDVLFPAVEALKQDGLEAAAKAAEEGMLATIPMQATKGRASYLGPRSVGHQDPGATSAYLLIRAAVDTWRSI